MTDRDASAAIGFGFQPERSPHHFFVLPPDEAGGLPMRVFERFEWEKGDADTRGAAPLLERDPRGRLRVELPPLKWDRVSPPLVRALNRRLRAAGLPAGRFRPCGTPVEEDLGKEMLVLLWATDLADPGQIDGIAANWSLFRPEELRWLYTMTDAAWGALNERRGWRAALREMLAAKPPADRESAFVSDVRDTRRGGFQPRSPVPPGSAGILPAAVAQERDPPGDDMRAPVETPPPHRRQTFGFRPEEGRSFFVTVPKRGAREPVLVREGTEIRPVARVPQSLWKRIAAEVADDFNARLREEGRATGSFAAGTTALGRLFGRELLVLLWALEPCAASCTPVALRNWKALAPAERRWLHTMTGANPVSWKRALAWLLCERPVIHQEENLLLEI